MALTVVVPACTLRVSMYRTTGRPGQALSISVILIKTNKQKPHLSLKFAQHKKGEGKGKAGFGLNTWSDSSLLYVFFGKLMILSFYLFLLLLGF